MKLVKKFKEFIKGRVIEDKFYTVDLYKYLDTNVSNFIENVAVEKLENYVIIDLKFDRDEFNRQMVNTSSKMQLGDVTTQTTQAAHIEFSPIDNQGFQGATSSNQDDIYTIYLTLKDNKVTDIDMKNIEINWRHYAGILYGIERMIVDFLILNKAYVYNRGTSDTGPR